MNRADSERAALTLIEHGRPHVAIDFVAIYRDEEGPAVSPHVILQALERLLAVLNEGTVDLSSIGYHITRLLNRLAASDESDESRVALLEWAYLPVVQNYGGPKVLHRKLSRNPDFFAKVVSLVYRGEGEERQEVTGGRRRGRASGTSCSTPGAGAPRAGKTVLSKVTNCVTGSTARANC